MSKHTPTPGEAIGDPCDLVVAIGWDDTPSAQTFIADCSTGPATDDEAAANAALIVRAVNAHDAMREVLQDIVDLYLDPHSLDMIEERARAVLKLAEGEA